MSDFLNDWISFELSMDDQDEELDIEASEVDLLCDCVLFHCREYIDGCYCDDDECFEEYYDDCEEEIYCTF